MPEIEQTIETLPALPVCEAIEKTAEGSRFFEVTIPVRAAEMQAKMIEWQNAKTDEERDRLREEMGLIAGPAAATAGVVWHTIAPTIKELPIVKAHPEKIGDLRLALDEEINNIVFDSNETSVNIAVLPEGHLVLAADELADKFELIREKLLMALRTREIADQLAPHQSGRGSRLILALSHQLLLDERGAITFAEFAPLCDKPETKLIIRDKNNRLTAYDEKGTEIPDLTPADLRLPA